MIPIEVKDRKTVESRHHSDSILGTTQMKKQFLIIAGLILSTTVVMAADRKAIYEHYLKFDTLVDNASLNANWLADGSSFWFAEGGPNDRVVWVVNPGENSKKPLFDTARLRSALTPVLGYEPPYAGVPFEQFTLSPDGVSASFMLEGKQFSLNLSDYSVNELPAPGPAAAALQERFTPKTFKRRGYFGSVTDAGDTLSPDRKWFATLQNDDIVLRSTIDGRDHRLTFDGTPENAWDIESMRLSLGAGLTISFVPFSSWSPDSLKLWALKIDRSAVAEKFEVNYLKTEDELVVRPFTTAGGRLSHVKPYIVDILSGEVVELALDDTENYYFTLLAWLPDSSGVLFGRYSRDFKTVDIMAADSESGQVRTLFTESAESFVKIQHDVISFGNSGFTLLPNGEQFLWESTRDGWNHLYLYDVQGRLIRQLTSGEYPVLDVVSIDPAGEQIYFSAHGETPRVYDTHLYRVSPGGGRVQQLTDGEGQHAAKLSPSFQYFIDTHSTTDRAPQTDLRSVDGTLIRTLQSADTAKLEAIGWTPTEEFTVKADDGETDLWGVMHKPADFDPSRKYPVLEYLYAGPQIVTANRSFAISGSVSSNLPRAIAQLGYIVVTLDARGTPERSKAFQDVVYRNWGQHEIPDHAAAIRQLGERHEFMDMSRVGIWGHSWGGHFAFRALADAPDVYHAAVSSAPGYDPYSSLLYEPYLDLPDRAKDAYEYASPFRLAGDIKGKLMIAVGTSDYATLTEAMKMSRALIDAGIHHEQVVLPQEGHGYTGAAEMYFIEALVDFFDRHLNP
jgi:dipeptidyl aminopeptidase/acylaminoacyl peptidase